MGLYNEILNGNKRSIARLITLVESRDNAGIEIYEKLYSRTGKAKTIGITGPPGSGKSTFINLIVRQYLDEGYKVGVAAVDPTSAFSGGAVLGDRIRMNEISNDKNCFVRSLATRGQLGGISSGTVDAVNILEAAGYDYVFIETVGTGQSEIDIVKYADIVLLITVPGLGDDIQAFKAGIMEIGDLIAINKADHREAQKTYNYIKSTLMLKKDHIPLVFLTDCINKKGIVEVKLEIERLLDIRVKNGEISKRRNKINEEELRKGIVQITIDRAYRLKDYNDVLQAINKKEISPRMGAKLLIKSLYSQEVEFDV